jgi:uncharacterized protein YjbI with pentapeptide repeats
MANPVHLWFLERGVDAWWKWREENILVKPDLCEANLSGADLDRADLSGADLTGANLSRAKLIEVDLGKAKLVHANLTEADLFRAYLYEADLTEVDLSKANLSGADLTVADLSKAKLVQADLSRADLNGADLTEADLSRADLTGAIFQGADLTGADLTGAELDQTVLTDLSLRDVKGLESINHLGPSSIGLDTIYLSNGEVPEVFLRSAGVPDSFITYMKSLVATALDFYSCFISYSTKDQEFVGRLHADLQSKGVRCWFAPQDIQGGKKVHEQIDEAIRRHDKLLLILSDSSMASEWVKTEIAHARQKEKSQDRRVLFPITLVNFSQIKKWKSFDADIGTDSAREIREYYIPDFTNWNSDDAAYKKEFDRLLRDLNPRKSTGA